MVKLQHNGRQYTITVPEDLVKTLGWEKGTELLVQKERDKNSIYIEKMGVQNNDR